MSSIEILIIAGTRPNFIKIAPLFHAFKSESSFSVKLCHTGQHYDRNMSESFWESLDLPAPDFDLRISAGNVPDTIGKTIIGVNNLLQENKFDLVIVVGDVNATVAGAIAAAQNGVKVMHVESGLRSFDRSMPEELNRIITDHISDFLMVSENSGLQNLKNEGIPDEKVHMVGNIMIESLIRSRPLWENLGFSGPLSDFVKAPFVAATFHRPENVDTKENLQKILDIIKFIARDRMVIFPVHPRTKNKLTQFGLMDQVPGENFHAAEPLGYFEFLKLVSLSDFVITDSGGIQEETSYFKKPCFTFRKNTERPVTIISGSNKLISIDDNNLEEQIRGHLNNLKYNPPDTIPLWDDQVSKRIIGIMHKYF
jgi:UDP-N-acetylglucosamine 2-epimerase (non-hydrolysing)